MSTPPILRRSARTTAQPQNFADEQFTHQYYAEELTSLRRSLQESDDSDVDDGSDEETVPVDEASSSESEDEEKENIPPPSSWSQHTHDVHHVPFTGQCGSNLPRHREMTELGYLRCFLPDSLIATVTTNTNLYAISKQAPAGWATTPGEVWLFISVFIFMGIVNLPRLHMYWEGPWSQSYVVKAFTRNRFKELLRYFHIAEPTPAGVKQDVVDKIKPLYDHCLTIFPEYFNPSEYLTLDEIMVRFKGRSFIKTIIKTKPTPVGYKVYAVASDGYLLTFQLYKGKGGYAVKQAVIHHTVMQLVQRWMGSNRILYTDNLYTSPSLCRDLLLKGLRSCGTYRSNRAGLPAGVKDAFKSLGEGETKAWQSGQLGCLVWRDKGPVQMLSTYHRVDDMVTFDVDRGPNRPSRVTKPRVVLDYNVGKCGVDTVDQLRQYYAMQRRSFKNWPSLAWWLIDMCVINSYTLWRLDTGADITQFDFREALLKQIPAAFPPTLTRTHIVPAPPLCITADGHWPKRVAKRRDCVHCSEGREHRVRSNFVCESCEVYLCADPCFKQWHVAQVIDN